MKIVLWIVVLLVGGFILLIIVQSVKESGDKRSASQKINDSCEKEFQGRGEIIINDCKIRLGIKRLQEYERDALSRADRGAR